MITLYGTTYCPACKVVKAKLDALGLNYSYVLLDQDPTALEYYTRTTGVRIVPGLIVEDRKGIVEKYATGYDDILELAKEYIHEDSM